MRWASWPSAYRNCSRRTSVRTDRNFSPARKVLSITLPSDVRRSLVRTNAAPLPGLTCWNSRTLKTVPSTSMWWLFLSWLVLIIVWLASPPTGRRPGPAPRRPLVASAAETVDAVAELLRWVLDDLREANDRHRVVHGDLAAVDLLQEVDHLVDPAELRVVVLDLPRRQVLDALDLDLVDHRVKDLLARGALVADRDQDALVLVVLVGFVAQTDRRGLAAATQLVGKHRGVEIEDPHVVRSLPILRPSRQNTLHDLSLAVVAQLVDGIANRHPAGLLD